MKNKTNFFVVSIIFYLIILFFVFHVGYIIEESSKTNIKSIIIQISNVLPVNIKEKPGIFILSISNKKQTILIPLIYTIVYSLYVLDAYSKATKFNRSGVEHGSARWGKISELKHLVGKNDNMILSNNIKLSTNGKKTKRNNNIIVFGGAGTGKSRFFIIPNLLQMNTSFVITDPKGSLVKNSAKLLKDNGYVIKVFNLIDMEQSNNYNPFQYITKGEEVFLLIDNLMKNTDGIDNKKGSDPFWSKSEKALLTCIIFYLYDKGEESEKNFENVLKCVQDFKNIDSRFIKNIKSLEKQDPTHVSVINYYTVMLAAENTLESILVSAGVRLSLMNLGPVKSLLNSDNIELDKLGDRKTALFVIIPDTSDSFNFIVAMLYTQLFQKLVEKADKNDNEMLNVPVRLLLDEFANIGHIPNFEILIATIRSRGISVSLILQNLSQLKTMYKDTWETIVGNCDTLIFLGGKEQGLLKYLSDQFGKETVHTKSKGISKGKSRTQNENDNIIARSLITIDELETLNNNDCIVSIRGFRPVIDKKYNVKKHKKYKETYEYSNKNKFSLKDNFETKIAVTLNNSEVQITDIEIDPTDVIIEFTEQGIVEKSISDFEKSILEKAIAVNE